MASNITFSGFSLAKQKKLTGDDYYDTKQFDNLTISIVCDGVGSAEYGALAAKRVTEHIINSFKNRPLAWSIEKSIKYFITSINKILYNDSILNYERPELVTTLALVVIEGNRLYGANVGDSRIYLRREEKITKLSHDHSLADEGLDNVLSNAIGLCEDLDIYYFENNLEKNDKLLICSDGLYSIMSENMLLKHMANGAYHIVKKASSLMKENLPDDTTAVIIDINDIDEFDKIKKANLPILENLSIGDNIDGYILEKPLIQNNRTWLCTKKGVKYVIKFAPIEALNNEKVLDLYIKEVWNSKRLKAGFFPKAVLPKNRSSRYYIMNFFEGISLKEYLKKRTLSVDESITLAKTLLHMLQYLAKYDLVHGDIKPENIIIINRDTKKIFKIIDFGSITEMYSLSNRAGTPSYLAPERFNESSINEQSEIYSVGVTIYESLTNKFPYGEIEPFQTPTFKSPKELKKLNQNIPDWLNSIIHKAITTNCDLRYKNYTEMDYELENKDKVKPFFEKNTPLLDRDPLKFYKFGFFFLLIINIITIYFVIS